MNCQWVAIFGLPENFAGSVVRMEKFAIFVFAVGRLSADFGRFRCRNVLRLSTVFY